MRRLPSNLSQTYGLPVVIEGEICFDVPGFQPVVITPINIIEDFCYSVLGAN